MKVTTPLSKSLRERNRSPNELVMKVVLEMEEKFIFDTRHGIRFSGTNPDYDLGLEERFMYNISVQTFWK